MKFSQDENKDLLIKAGLGLAAYYVLKELYTKYQKGDAEDQMDTNPASVQAAAIIAAFNPSGFAWLRAVDGTKVPALMEIAPQITSLDEVAKRYSALTEGRNLYDDLQAELSTDDVQKFYSLASKGKTGSWYYAKESTNVPANYWVFTIADANVRKAAVKAKSNIVKLVTKGKILGATTGKFAYDEKNKILFIEFWTLLQKENKRVTYFVAKSQIELVSNADKMARDKKQGKTPLELIEGIGGIDYKQEVITISSAMIYDQKFKQVGIVSKNTIVGFPLMTLDTGKGKHIQIKTVQGLIRWIKADQAQIRDRQF